MLRAVIVISGGLDSLVTTALLRKSSPNVPLNGLFVDYGQQAAEQEKQAATRIARKYGVCLDIVEVSMPFLSDTPLCDPSVEIFEVAESKRPAGGDPSVIVPFRNMIILGMAASLAATVEADQIWVGFDHRPGAAVKDISPEFVSAMNASINKASSLHSPPLIVAPLNRSSKKETIETGISLKVDFKLSWSCYNGASDSACGKCPACVERKEAFKALGLKDPA
jgi:7-cyano-7-deazaguanine synthase